ncbi:hypothetical protein ABIQ69_11615 [Agromyces sp. G08B096]|uniref:Uncharacterized protein n=1 Tax=Agromyces sp. G08B096 TaxID=3156399 RepID=A0AAU7W495_9MICO
MRQNPWSVALGIVGVLGLVVAVIAYFIAQGMGLDGMTVLSFSTWLAQFAGFALVAYMLFEAFAWWHSERRRADDAADARQRVKESPRT